MNRLAGRVLLGVEILILSGLILATRCANYPDVFVRGHIYFTDADCYARMTRVRLCAREPGLVLRHHSFENFPSGTTPHTTAPLDYAILLFSLILRPFSPRSIDLAGALISPLLAILTGGFLCCWARRVGFRFRWAMLLLFVISPILVHGTALGRPDHQSLVLLLVTVAVCADWILQTAESTGWSIVSGISWGLAIWVSAYEPLVLFVVSVVAAIGVLKSKPARNASHSDAGGRSTLNGPSRTGIQRPTPNERGRDLFVRIFGERFQRTRWIVLGAVVVCALLIERRMPSFSVFVNDPIFHNWSRTIGELSRVSLFDPVWFGWVGWLILAVPVLLLVAIRTDRTRNLQFVPMILLIVTFGLTLWQARWGYFFATMFVVLIPGLLGWFNRRWIGWILFACSLWPILRNWDDRIWPNDTAAARQFEQRQEAVELHELSVNLISATTRPFLAPWWLSPAISYWSGQPGIAGSSHESLSGIADSARFYLATDPAEAIEILQRRNVSWVVVYDAERVEENSAMILGKAGSERCLGRVLDRTPARAPRFLTLFSQNGSAKIFEVTDKW